MKPLKCDYNKGLLITVTIITLSGFHSTSNLFEYKRNSNLFKNVKFVRKANLSEPVNLDVEKDEENEGDEAENEEPGAGVVVRVDLINKHPLYGN